jgi:hypothetical protein
MWALTSTNICIFPVHGAFFYHNKPKAGGCEIVSDMRKRKKIPRKITPVST